MKTIESTKDSIIQTINDIYLARKDVPELCNFMRDIYNVDIENVMPLNFEETYIIRCLLHVNENYSKEYLDSLETEFSLDTILKGINDVLYYYIDYIESDKTLFDDLSDADKELTIFDYSLDNISYETLYNLRMLNIYYLKDLTLYTKDFLRKLISEDDLNIIYSYIDTYSDSENGIQKTRE